MRIQPILNIKTNSTFKNNKNISAFSKAQSDSVSFKGKILTYEELRPLKLRAWQIQEDSINHKKDAQSVKDEAYNSLNEAKSEFLQALKYCNYYKKNPSKTSVELKNGNHLNFQFELKNGNFTLEIEETDEDGATIKTISAVNFVPAKIANFKQEGIDIFEFKGNNVAVTKNLSVDGMEFGTCDATYAFSNGKLSTASFNGNVASSPSSFDKTYTYMDDKLLIYSCGNTVYHNGKCSSDERYIYIGESMSNYYSAFSGNLDGGMRWEESLHFDKGKFIGSINNGIQQAQNQDIISTDATFLNDDNQFIHTTKLRARVSDFGLPIFADFE